MARPRVPLWLSPRRRRLAEAARDYAAWVHHGNEALDDFLETVVEFQERHPGAPLGDVIAATRSTIEQNALLDLERRIRPIASDEQWLQGALLRIQARQHTAPPEW